jgi:hypothetical protein
MMSFRSFLTRQSDALDSLANGKTFDLLDRFFVEMGSLARNVHFDLMYNNIGFLTPLWWPALNSPSMLEYFRTREFSVIHLTRDPFSTYASLVYSKQTKIFHQSNAQPLKNTPQPSTIKIESLLDADDFRHYREELILSKKIVEDSFSNYPWYVNLAYEELLDGKDSLSTSARAAIVDALGGNEDPTQLQLLPAALRPTTQPSALAKQLARLRATIDSNT